MRSTTSWELRKHLRRSTAIVCLAGGILLSNPLYAHSTSLDFGRDLRRHRVGHWSDGEGRSRRKSVCDRRIFRDSALPGASCGEDAWRGT